VLHSLNIPNVRKSIVRYIHNEVYETVHRKRVYDLYRDLFCPGYTDDSGLTGEQLLMVANGRNLRGETSLLSMSGGGASIKLSVPVAFIVPKSVCVLETL